MHSNNIPYPSSLSKLIYCADIAEFQANIMKLELTKIAEEYSVIQRAVMDILLTDQETYSPEQTAKILRGNNPSLSVEDYDAICVICKLLLKRYGNTLAALKGYYLNDDKQAATSTNGIRIVQQQITVKVKKAQQLWIIIEKEF